MSAGAAGEGAPPQPAGSWSLSETVDALCEANAGLLHGPTGKLRRRFLPSREVIAEVVSGLRVALFPWHFGAESMSDAGLPYYVGRTLDSALGALEGQLRIGFDFECGLGDRPCPGCAERATRTTRELALRLPSVRALLGSDAQAAYEGDPAATSPDETVFSYAGMTAITYHRIAHELHGLGVPLIPRMIAELAHATTGVDIHPGARIGPRFFIDHGTGVVIGETCVIGEHVRLYQGVTLGAKSFPSDDRGNPIKGIPRHPIIEDDVIIYAGATVLGRITIGKGSTIGGNVWLTHSLPPGSHVSQARAREESFAEGAGI